MAKPDHIELPTGLRIPILYEDRVALAIDKPVGWLCAPSEWDFTGRNLLLALESSIAAGDFWARSRQLRYLRFVHRLDADTSGVLLLAKSTGALKVLTELFEDRRVDKAYLAVVNGEPAQAEWTCRHSLAPEPSARGRMRVDEKTGKASETQFRVLAAAAGRALIEARPLTGRTHQIRVHLAESGHPVLGDHYYGNRADRSALALRAVRLEYFDPFQKRPVWITAPAEEFIRSFGFPVTSAAHLRRRSIPPTTKPSVAK